MKKTTNILGIIFSVFVILGSLFKIQHWPGGGLILILGVLFLLVAYIPMNLITELKAKKGGLHSAMQVVFAITFWFILTAVLFKVQHWPGGSSMYAGGIILLVVFLVPLTIANVVKNDNSCLSKGLPFIIMFVSLFMMNSAKNYSKSILISYVINEENAARTGESLKLINERLITELASSDKIDNVDDIHNVAIKEVNLIDDYKKIIIGTVMGYSFTPAMIPDSLYDLEHVHSLDNYDIPTAILIGSEPANPKTDDFSAINLKNHITRYKEQLLMTSNNDANKKSIEMLLECQDIIHHGISEPWEISQFYHLPLAGVIHNLTLIQNNILSAENIILNEVVTTANQ